jgi:hypothetical protein
MVEAIEEGKITTFNIVGVISDIKSSGHNDFIEFEINSNGEKSVWQLLGRKESYFIGKKIKLTYVEQKFKQPTDISGVISKCIIKITSDEQR